MNLKCKYQIVGGTNWIKLAGYYDYIFIEKIASFTRFNIRARKLARLLKDKKPHYIHALEFQGAGYLLTEINPKVLKVSKVIATNWGSDIYYFKNFERHLKIIEKVLKIADYYSAECVRDYRLAREMGFEGVELPCIPNAGGFDLQNVDMTFSPPSESTQILVKGYGGLFGRADLPINLIPEVIQRFPKFSFFIYSVTPDSFDLIMNLPRSVRDQIRVSRVGSGLTHEEMQAEFRKSRLYIGCSESDGVSTSFLESLVNGTYPIQTGTSCANEWVQRGARASIVDLSPTELLKEIEFSLKNDEQVDLAAAKNLELAKARLGKDYINQLANTYYLA
jgi:glycosyltransferase involved in cell wall biosynthesis